MAVPRPPTRDRLPIHLGRRGAGVAVLCGFRTHTTAVAVLTLRGGPRGCAVECVRSWWVVWPARRGEATKKCSCYIPV